MNNKNTGARAYLDESACARVQLKAHDENGGQIH